MKVLPYFCHFSLMSKFYKLLGTKYSSKYWLINLLFLLLIFTVLGWHFDNLFVKNTIHECYIIAVI
jgi:hypothetical protein